MRYMRMASSSSGGLASSGERSSPEIMYIFCGQPLVKTMIFHGLAAGTIIFGMVSFFLDVLTYTYFQNPRIGTFWYAIPCILCMCVVFWSSSNLHVLIATGLGLVGVAFALYASVVDISASENIFDLQICRNFKGEMFGELSNDNAIRANMQGCDAILAVGDHDLYCTTNSANSCYLFDGIDDGSVIWDDFSPLLKTAIAFKALVLFGIFMYTFCALFAIIDMHYFSNSKVYIEDRGAGAEMLRLSREEKLESTSVVNSRKMSKTASVSRPISDSELLGY